MVYFCQLPRKTVFIPTIFDAKKGMSRLKMSNNSNKSSLINIIITYLDSIRYLKVTNKHEDFISGKERGCLQISPTFDIALY